MRPCCTLGLLLLTLTLVVPPPGVRGSPNSQHCPCRSWGCQPACPCACPCPCDDQSLCDPLSSAKPATPGELEVFAFHAHLYNESGDAVHHRSGAQNFERYPWANLSTVAIYTGVGNDTNGTWTTELLCTAHKHQVRVVLGCGGQWTAAPWTADTIGDSTKRAALIKQYIDSAVINGLDGLSLDVEYDGSKRSAAWYAQHSRLLTIFACELQQTIKNLSKVGYLPDTFRVSFTSDVSPAASADRFDYKGLAKCIDFFTPMAYHESLASLEAGVSQYPLCCCYHSFCVDFCVCVRLTVISPTTVPCAPCIALRNLHHRRAD
jgi:hypothetical protein